MDEQKRVALATLTKGFEAVADLTRALGTLLTELNGPTALLTELDSIEQWAADIHETFVAETALVLAEEEGLLRIEQEFETREECDAFIEVLKAQYPGQVFVIE